MSAEQEQQQEAENGEEEEDEWSQGHAVWEERFKIVDDEIEFPFPCMICGRLVSREEFDEGLGYRLCNSGCWPPGGETMTHYAHHDYMIDGEGMLWSGCPDEPEPYTHLSELPICKHHPKPEHYYEYPLSRLEEQVRIEREGGSYQCFVCGQQHTHERSPSRWHVPVPPLAAAGAPGEGAGDSEQEQQQQAEGEQQAEEQQQAEEEQQQAAEEAEEEEGQQEPPAKRARA